MDRVFTSFRDDKEKEKTTFGKRTNFSKPNLCVSYKNLNVQTCRNRVFLGKSGLNASSRLQQTVSPEFPSVQSQSQLGCPSSYRQPYRVSQLWPQPNYGVPVLTDNPTGCPSSYRQPNRVSQILQTTLQAVQGVPVLATAQLWCPSSYRQPYRVSHLWPQPNYGVPVLTDNPTGRPSCGHSPTRVSQFLQTTLQGVPVLKDNPTGCPSSDRQPLLSFQVLEDSSPGNPSSDRQPCMVSQFWQTVYYLQDVLILAYSPSRVS